MKRNQRSVPDAKAIIGRRRKMGRRWNKDEERFLKENYFHMSNVDLAFRLNRSFSSISDRLVKYHLIKLNKDDPPFKIGEKIKLCKCGCGEWITYKKFYSYYGLPKYLIHHHPPWNKGLTKKDPRVMKCAKKLVGRKPSEESREKNRIAHLGKKQSEEKKRKRGLYEPMSHTKESKGKLRKKVYERIKNETFYYNTKNPKSNKKRSESMKKRWEESPEIFTILSGDKHWNWIDGRSYEPYPQEFWNIRKKILKRDEYVCQSPFCDGKCKKVGVHHINYDKKDNKTTNLITLCNRCNSMVNFDRIFMQNMFEQLLSSKESTKSINRLFEGERMLSYIG